MGLAYGVWCVTWVYIYMVYVQTSLDNCVLCRQIWDSLSVRSRFGWVWPIECGVLHGYIYIYIWYIHGFSAEACFVLR